MARTPFKPAFALIEVAISILIVSVMLVAALNAAGASRVGQVWNTDHLRAIGLAQDLMSEICDRAYEDPNEPPIFGPEATEILTGRPAYDDVDDYNGFSESPPKDRTGAALPGLTNWSRTVAVAWVSPANPNTTSLVETGVKRITVTVLRGGAPLARLVALRSSAAPR